MFFADEVSEPLVSDDLISSNQLENDSSELHKRAIELARSSNFAEALKIFDELLKRNDIERDLLLSDYIAVLSWSNRHADAVKLFDEEIAKGGFTPKAYVLREIANSCLRVGRNNDALRFYEKALELQPDDDTALEGAVLAILNLRGKEEALQFLENYAIKVGAEKFNLNKIKSEIYRRIRDTEKQLEFLEKAIKNNPSDLSAKIAKAEILVARRDVEKLKPFIDELVKDYPQNPDVMILEVYYYQISKEPLKAYALAEKILAFNPFYQPAVNAKYHILLDIGAAQAADRILKESADKVPLEVRKRILGDLSAQQIRFLAPKRAKELLEENERYAKEYLQKEDSAEAADIFLRRSQFDRFLAMRQAEMMRDIVENYEKLKEENIAMPYWVREAAADAYLYLKKPERAIELYEEVLNYYKEKGLDKYPYNYNVLMAKHVTLIELERHREAMQILEKLDEQVPYFARPGGIFTENWHKVDIAVEKVWSLIYDDRLKEAEDYLDELVSQIPNNSNPRIAQAYLHLYRGFPRLALEDFQICTNMNPDSKTAMIGKAYALDYNDRSEEGRQIAKELLEKYPEDLGVQKLNRHFEIQDMRLLSIKSNFSQGGSFVDGAGYTIRLDQPVYPWRKIYAETLWLQTKDEFEGRDIFRSGAGVDWRLNRDLTLDFGVSIDHRGKDVGIKGGLRWDVDDHLSLSGSFDSYSLNLPPKALLYKYKGKEAKFSAVYRFSEDLITQASFSNIWMSDGNLNQNYTIRLDKGLTYSARWKTRIALEGYLTKNTKYKDRGYYAPEYTGAIYFVPMIEHMWYRRYDFSIFDRLYFGIGPHWEKGFKVGDVWFIRYEQEWRLTDTFSFKAGAQYGKSRYGNDKPHSWNFYLELYYRF